LSYDTIHVPSYRMPCQKICGEIDRSRHDYCDEEWFYRHYTITAMPTAALYARIVAATAALQNVTPMPYVILARRQIRRAAAVEE